MAELTLGLDPQQARFSTNFLDDLDVTKAASEGTSDVAQPELTSPVSTNPFRSESPTLSDHGLELDHDAPEFDFEAHLETHDSMSSLDQVGLSSPTTDQDAHQLGVNGVSADSSEKVDPTGVQAESKTPILVAQTSEHWETFDENGRKVNEPHPPTANGGHSGGQDKDKGKCLSISRGREGIEVSVSRGREGVQLCDSLSAFIKHACQLVLSCSRPRTLHV